jgi:hypothetical protein
MTKHILSEVSVARSHIVRQYSESSHISYLQTHDSAARVTHFIEFPFPKIRLQVQVQVPLLHFSVDELYRNKDTK